MVRRRVVSWLRRGHRTASAAWIAAAPLFDAAYYAARAGVPVSAAASHYCDRGWRSGLDPSPYFSTSFYLAANPDVARSGLDPLSHYLLHGWREGRAPHPDFALTLFKELNGGFDFTRVDAAVLCLARHGSYDFEPGLVARVAHYGAPKLTADELARACDEVRPFVDSGFYASMYPETEGEDAVSHYVSRGWGTFRNPSPDFDTAHYLAVHMEGGGPVQCPLLHYVRRGRHEGLATLPADRIALVEPRADATLPTAAVHIHAFHLDILGEIAACLGRGNRPLPVFVTVTSAEARDSALRAMADILPGWPIDIRTVANRGRDIAPFLVACPDVWASYDWLLHLHTKKSDHTAFGDAWRRYLLDMLAGDGETIDTARSFLGASPELGLLYPENFHRIKAAALRASAGPAWTAAVRVSGLRPAPGGFPASSMGWFRTAAFRNFAASLRLEDFEIEQGQTDGTLAHAIERLLPAVAARAGFRAASFTRKRRPGGG